MSPATCAAPACAKRVYNKTTGYCNKHYTRVRRYGSIDGYAHRRAAENSEPHWASTETQRTVASLPLPERMAALSVPQPNGCIRWAGRHLPSGYGTLSIGGREQRAHRVAYELAYGAVPDGLELDHVYDRGCRFRDCVNLEHLEPVTHAENVRRQKSRITHCPKGHEYTPDNTKLKPGVSGPMRYCIACAKEHSHARVACPHCGKSVNRGWLGGHIRAMHTDARAAIAAITPEGGA